MASIRLIVGLGNPGPDYAATRHNAGFWLLDLLARQHSATLRAEGKFFSLYARAGETHLLEPQTFMNASGKAVAAVARFYKIQPDEILVVHDELDLPPGAAKLKQGGGHGGHNGLRDIIAALGVQDFWRLRLGIGHPGNKAEVVSFVLKPPRKEEQDAIDRAIDCALDVMPAVLAGKMPEAMKDLHTRAK